MAKDITLSYIEVSYVEDNQSKMIQAKSIVGVHGNEDEDEFCGFYVQCYRTGKVVQIRNSQVTGFGKGTCHVQKEYCQAFDV